MATINVKSDFVIKQMTLKSMVQVVGITKDIDAKLQRWLWYAWEPRLKRIIAHAFGDRSTETLNVLLMRIKQFNVAFWFTDKFKAYDILPKEKHIVRKLYTQQIERENLTLRNRLKRLNRKTLGYSKSADIHNKIIGIFIERNYYF